MALIECTHGPSTNHVNGTTYSFEIDEHGRYVAEVPSIADQAVLCSVQYFRLAGEPPPKRGRPPGKGKGEADAKGKAEG
ncbi:hypothetical protein BN1110_06297 [bacterium YEK0313]|nr:hypothetical protein BN1110_06297 [bacterium YEK0313]